MSAEAGLDRTVVAALEALPFPLCVYDAALVLVFANPAAAAVLGGPDGRAPIGANLREIARTLAYRGRLGPGDPEAIAAHHLSLDRSRPLRRLLREDGGRVVDFRTIPLPDGGFCAVTLDVTEHAATGDEAMARAQMLETVLRHLEGGVALYDADRRLVLSNPRYEELIGMPPGAVRPGVSRGDLLRQLAERGEFINADSEALVAAAIGSDPSVPHGYTRTRPNGTVVQVESRPVARIGQLVEMSDITALKRAEDEASRRAGLLDGVLAALPHGVLVIGPDQRIAMANAAYQAIMADSPVVIGEHRSELIRRRAAAGEYGTAGDQPAHGNLAAAEAEGRRRHVRPNGDVLDVRYAPLPDGGTVVVLTDITPLDQAEAAARERAALLQVMLDSMRHGIALFDGESRLVTVNALAAHFCGLTAEQCAPGRHFEDLVADQIAKGEFSAEDVEARARRRAVRARDYGRPQSYRRVRPDGTVLEVVSDPIPTGGFVVTYSDVTARARAEAEAQERAELLQNTIDHLRQGIIVYGPDRRVRITNRLAGELAGHAPDAVRPGRSLEEIVHDMIPAGALPPGPESEALVRRTLTYDRTRPQTVVRRARNGRVIEVHSDPLPDGGFIVSHIDITALSQAEAEARQRAAMLQAMLDTMRHGIALYGADRRLRLANALAASLCGLPDGELAPGELMDDLIDRQYVLGVFGHGEEAAAYAARLKALDRARHHAGTRVLPDGRVVEMDSTPTADGGFVVTWSDVTARASAEEAARRRAAQLQGTLDGVRHGIALYGPDRRLVLANRLAAPEQGLPYLEERIGMPFDLLVREQLRLGVFGTGEQAERTCAEVIGLDRTRSHHYQRPLPSGRVMEVRSDPTPDGGFVITHSDVTELVQAQSEASRRAALLQVMLDNMRHGIVFYGPDRRLIAANALAADLGGHAPGTLRPGRTLEELIAEQVGTEIGHETAEMARRLDRTRPHRYVRPRPDGGVVEVTSDPTPDGGFVVTMSDITALAEAEGEAKRRATMQQVMLDNIRHGILLVDAEGLVVAANRVFRQLLGLPEETVAAGVPFTRFVDWLEAHGEYGEGEAAVATARSIRERDRSRPIRSIRTRPDGTVLEAVSDPTPDGGWVLTFTDVTAARRAQEEIERARDAAEAANRAKSRFLATMSHELRTPLNAVIGFSEALMSMPPGTTETEYLRAIHDAGRHLLSLIDDILDVTRAETTGFNVTESPIDPARVAEDAIRVMGSTASESDVTLRTAIEPGLPLLQADELRLRQVLLNLLSNAVKFTPAGGSVTLSVAREEAGGVTLRVVDTGIGIAPEDIARAFEPFTQLDNALARRFQGSGLGLYLSRALAAAQGAELSLESTPGLGTTAILHFPAARVAPG